MLTDEDIKAEMASQAAESEEESSTLEPVMEAKMAAIRDKEFEDDSTEEEDPKEEDDSTEDDSTEDDSTEDDSTEDDSTEDDSTEEEDSDKDELPMLPSGHRAAALKHGGYTNEEVDHYLEIKPVEAVERFAEIFVKWQEQNSLWSARGRELSEGKSKEDTGADTSTSEPLSHYDTKALIEEYGADEGLINAIIGPLNATIDRVNAQTEKMSNSEQFLRDTELQAVEATTEEFLGSAAMKPYRETYGTDRQKLTDAQVKSRMDLFGQADDISAGAKDHGKDISIIDALERAHIIQSQGTRDEAIRLEIKASMKKRTKMTAHSRHKTSAPDDGQPISDEDMVKRVEARQRKMRNS